MKERPILIATIGYIIGILGGLYFKTSIVLYYIPIVVIYYLQKKFFKTNKKRKFKLISVRRYSKYLKLMLNKKSIFILIIFSILSNTNVLIQNRNYETTYLDEQDIKVRAIVMSKKIEKQYYHLYQVKLLDSKNFNLSIQVNKKVKDLEYGDEVLIEGKYKKPSKKRNYGGYDEELNFKTQKIIGKMKVTKIEVLAKKQLNPILQLANKTRIQIEKRIEDTFSSEEAAILKGLLLGDTTNIQEQVKENFRILNISHILAISGMHISYVVIGIQILFKKLMGKRKTNVITILILIFYSFITGFSSSVIRAVIMGILARGSQIFNRKNDVLNSIAISLFIILLYQPFSILKVGFQLSYLGTIGIILFESTILKTLHWIPGKKLKEMIAVSLSAQITMLPILCYHFNTISIYFLLSNLLISLVIGPIILFGFLSLFVKVFAIPVKWGVFYVTMLSRLSQLPFAKMYVITPNIICIIMYFISLWIIHLLYTIYHSNHNTPTKQRVKNLIALFRYQTHLKKKTYKKYSMIIVLVIFSVFLLPKNLKIYFVDVGQGDCTFIVTPKNKTILIDGGGTLSEEFDVGKKTLIPYLLDRGYTRN